MKRNISPRQFYYNLQNSRLKEHAFYEWEEYRNEVSDLLIESCDTGKTLAIFGAGQCNDINLEWLSGHFAKIVLIDINKAALLSAIKRYTLAAHAIVQLLVRDFVGITDEDYVDYASTVLEYVDKNASNTSNTMKQLNHMYKKAQLHTLDFGNKQYDYSLVLNVHSQLNDTADWIWTEAQKLLGKPVDHRDPIRTYIHHKTDEIIKKFNDALFAATKETAFIGYETGMEGSNHGGIHGAMQACQDLRKREQWDKIKSVQQNRLTWPYDRSRQIVFSIMMESVSVLV